MTTKCLFYRKKQNEYLFILVEKFLLYCSYKICPQCYQKKERKKFEENKGRSTLFTARSLRVLLADVGENTM